MNKKRLWLICAVALYHIIFLFFTTTTLPRFETVDIADMTIEGALFVCNFLLLVFFQKFKGPRKVYSYITIGLSLTTLYHVADMMDELVEYPPILQYILDDTSHLFSIIFIIMGIFHWLAYNNSIMDQLKKLATIDGLTNIYNRQHIDIILEEQRNKASRYKRELAVILIDIDHFKGVNDTYGHATGDSVLISLCSIVNRNIRTTDRFGRYGGEEFLLVLPETSLDGAETVGEKLRTSIEAYDFPGVPHITASFGIAVLLEDETLAELVHRADEALYKAKEAGRNQLSLA